MASKVSVLCCEVANLSQAADPSQQELQLPVGSSRDVLWDLMSCELDRAEGQAALVMSYSEITRAGHVFVCWTWDRLIERIMNNFGSVWMIRYVELFSWA